MNEKIKFGAKMPDTVKSLTNSSFLIAIAMILLVSGSFAFAAHTATVTLDKTFVRGGATETYAFTVTKDSGNDIQYTYITIPDGFTYNSATCPFDWNPVYTPTVKILKCDGEFSTQFITTSADVKITAISPATEGTSSWIVKTKDTTGTLIPLTSLTTTVDNTVPIVSIDAITTPTKIASQTVTGTFTEANIDNIKVNGVDATITGSSYSATITLSEGSHTVTAVATDKVGFTGSATQTVVLDTVAPTTSDNADALWHKADVTVTLTPTDPLPSSGIAHTYYTTDGTDPTTSGTGTTRTDGTSVLVSAEGTTTIKYYSVDAAGNSETSVKQRNVNIDKTVPSTSVISAPAASSYQKSTITVTADATDNIGGSGVQKVEFYKDGALLGTDTNGAGGWSYDWTTTASDDGSHSLTAKVYDMAGNTKDSAAVTITVDNTAPSFSSITASPTQAKVGDVTITFTASEVLTTNPTVNVNEHTATYSSNTENNYIYTYTVTPTDTQGPATISITGLDITGNSGTSTSTSVLTVDTVAPTASITLNPVSPVSAGTVAVTLATSESIPSAPTLSYTPNGKSSITVSLTGSGTTWTGTMAITDSTGDGTATFSYSGTDAAGNPGTQITSGSSFVIDTVPPVVNTISSPAISNSQTFGVTYSASDLNGINSVKLWYKLNDVWTAYDNYQSNTGTISFTAPQVGTYMFYVQAKDNAGKESSSPILSTTTTAITEARPTAVYVYTSGSGTHVLNWDAFNTIQSGIDAVAVGGTVNVDAGTYPESVLIGKSLTLVGTGGKPVISGAAGDNYVVKVNGIQGVTVDNFEINGGSTNTFNYGILVSGSGSVLTPIEIKNSIIKNVWNNGGNGIGVESSSYALVHDNTVSSFHKNGIRIITSGGKFYNNEVIGDNVDGTNRVQNLVNVRGGSTFEIYGNKLHGALTTGPTPIWDSTGILVSAYLDSPPYVSSTANIHDNEIYNSDSGIVVSSYYATTDSSSAIITNNNLHDLNWAINFEKGTASATINDNKFSNVNRAVSADDSTGGPAIKPAVNAKNNWWGSKQKSTIISLIYAGVDYDPWYLDPVTKVLSSTDIVSPGVGLTDNINTRTSVKNTDRVTITATFSDTNGLDTGVTPTISITNSGVTGVAMTSTADPNVWTYEWNVPSGDASAEVSVTAKDVVGNVNSLATGKTSYTIDNTLPVITVSSVTTPTDVSTQTITGTYTEVNLDKIFVNGIQANINENTYSASIPLTEGTNTITVVATDLAGNSVTDNSKSIVLDTNLPSITDVAQTPEYVRLNTPVTVSATVKDNVGGVGLKTGGVVLHYMVNGIVHTPIAMTNLNEVYSATITTADFVDGVPVAYYITAEDGAGNTQTSASKVFVVDGLTPSLVSYSPSTGAVGVDTATTINLAFSEDMDNTTFSGVTLKDTNNNPVTINLQSYNSATHTAIFNYSGTLGSNKGYTVTLTGLKDLAGNVLPTTTWSFTTATSYSITLSKKGVNGWNLISLPVVPANIGIQNVLSNVMNDVLEVWTHDSVADKWHMYKANDPSSDLSAMTAGYGYWINYNNDTIKSIAGSGSLFLEGPSTPPQRTLAPGWNLIGYYQRENTDAISASCALETLRYPDWWTMLTGYDNTGKGFTSVGTADNLAPGQAYWIFMTSEKDKYQYGPGLPSPCV